MVIVGNVADEFVRVATEERTHLIIMGIQGKSGRRRMHLDSVCGPSRPALGCAGDDPVDAARDHGRAWTSAPISSVTYETKHPARRERVKVSTAVRARLKLTCTNRCSFLTGLGLNALALVGLAPFSRIAPRAWAGTKPTQFVYAWTAFDLLTPHAKHDGNAYFFNLNMYDKLLR